MVIFILRTDGFLTSISKSPKFSPLNDFSIEFNKSGFLKYPLILVFNFV